jgi:hypothetical protein
MLGWLSAEQAEGGDVFVGGLDAVLGDGGLSLWLIAVVEDRMADAPWK